MSLLHRAAAYLVIALAVSFDGLGVGASYGARGLEIPPSSLACISALTGVLMAVSMGAGGYLAGFVPPEAARFFGGVIIVALGAWQCWQGYLEVLERKLRTADGAADYKLAAFRVKPLGIVVQILKEPLAADRDASGSIDSAESVFLGVALGLDAFAAGFGASLGGFSWAIVPLVAIACPALILLGCRIGRSSAKFPSFRWSYALPGALLVIIGLLKAAGRI